MPQPDLSEGYITEERRERGEACSRVPSGLRKEEETENGEGGYDHAFRLAKFAMECMDKMPRFVKRMETRFGTRELVVEVCFLP